MALMTIPGAPNDPTGPLCIGTDLLNGVPQSAAGSFGITAIYVARGRDDATLAALRQLARDHLAPIVAPISAVAAAGAPRTLDLAPYVTDPAGAGYSVAVGALPPGLGASVAGSVLTYSSAAEASYSLPLTFTGLNSLQPARTVAAHLTLASESARWSNGYRWRSRINLLPWSASGTIANFLLPFAEVDPAFCSVANGGYVESADARDFRLETAAGVKIPHVLLAYDPVIGLIAGLGNIAARNIGVAEAGYAFVGKPGLTASEEDPVGCRAGGWLFFSSGHSAADFSGQGRDWTTNVDVGQGRIGSWPAGAFNGSTSYRARASSEMNGLAGVTIVALVQSAEGVGRTQEFLNVAPADVADLALRLGSGGNWVLVIDAGGQLQAVQSDTGLYYPSRPHAVAGVWSSGARPSMYVDGALVDPDTPPAVATGTTAINEALELGRGNRPPGAATWWNDLIGPVLGCGRGLARAEIECLSAALAEPRLVYGRGAFKTVDTIAVPPIAQPVEVSVSAGSTSAPIDVQAAAYNPDELALTTTLGALTVGSATIDSSGRVSIAMPTSAASRTHRIPFTLTSGTMSSSSVITVRVAPATATDGQSVQLPVWPVSYTGTTYYVSTAAPAGNALSASRSNPGAAQHALNNAPSLSKIVFLGAGPYPNLTVNRPTNVHLKLIADVPAFSDLINLRPQTLTVDQLNTLEDIVVKDKNLTTSCRLRQLLLQAGGYIWVEGFRSDGDRFNVASGSASGRSNIVGSWFEKIHINQCPSTNMLIIGPANGANKLNVVHKFWCKSYNELGDPGYPGGGGLDPVGTAVTDYGIRSDVDCGAMQILECFFQMRSNHMISFKKGNGANDAAMKNRVEGCLFASWNRDYSLTQTCIEMGQECDTDATGDTTVQDTDILNNTFADPKCHPILAKNVTRFVFDGNRIILHNRLMISGITASANGTGKVIGPLHPISGRISNNVIMESSGKITLYSVGMAATYTFENNTTQNLINIDVVNRWWMSQRMASGVPSPRIVVVKGSASGIGTVTNA